MPLIRLIYRSQNAISVTGSRMLIHYNDIVTTARRRNAEENVSGFLMFDREHYHQILEGEEAQVDGLYARIKSDTRHRNVELLMRREIIARGFPDWSMGAFLSVERQHPLLAKYGIIPKTAVDGDKFLAFAMEFVDLEPNAA